MRNGVVILSLYLLMSFLMGCHRPPVEERMTQIENLLDKAQYGEARESANSLMEEVSNDNFISTGNLNRLALIYVILADRDSLSDYESDIDRALILYRRALNQNADSVAFFANEVDSDNSASWDLLGRLTSGEFVETVIDDFEYADSIKWNNN